MVLTSSPRTLNFHYYLHCKRFPRGIITCIWLNFMRREGGEKVLILTHMFKIINSPCKTFFPQKMFRIHNLQITKELKHFPKWQGLLSTGACFLPNSQCSESTEGIAEEWAVYLVLSHRINIFHICLLWTKCQEWFRLIYDSFICVPMMPIKLQSTFHSFVLHTEKCIIH